MNKKIIMKKKIIMNNKLSKIKIYMKAIKLLRNIKFKNNKRKLTTII